MGTFTVQQMRGGYKFNLKARNGQIIASSQIHHTMKDCLAAIDRMKLCAEAPMEDRTVSAVEELPFPKFAVQYNDRDAICFCLFDENGALLATSKGYTAKRSCFAGIRSIAENAPGASVITG